MSVAAFKEAYITISDHNKRTREMQYIWRLTGRIIMASF